MTVRPGPKMNMIIGPNGSGKSTIVCAIALGLGGNTSVLGRAKELSAFVKHGKQSGSVEIYLRTNDAKGFITVKRIFKSESNNTDWMLNGKSCTQKEVHQVVRKLNIQVDNLW